MIEMLVVIALTGMLTMAYLELIPVIQRNIIREAQLSQARESLWQIAYGIAKQLRRAGYCLETCSEAGLRLQDSGQCALIHWQSQAVGRGSDQYIGYRFFQGCLQMRKDAKQCTGAGWEKLNDPTQLYITHFKLAFYGVLEGRTRMALELAGRSPKGGRTIKLRHIITAENL